MDLTFKALADPTRRQILDILKSQPGQTVQEMSDRFPMSRIGVLKHIRLLEAAHLIVSHKDGRRRLLYLNAIPLQLVQDRWMSAYSARWAAGLTALKHHLEQETTMKPSLVYQVFIRTQPERLWQALTQSADTRRYFYGMDIECDWRVGSELLLRKPGEAPALECRILEIDPPRCLVTTFRMMHKPETIQDAATKVTWSIEPQGALCKLTLTHEDFVEETVTYREVSQGWNPILSGLKTLLETGEPLFEY
jgi:uncharacterized protein YndB with AHSA1/START domain/DNA-binding transcriptional ArsR family regulator